VRRTALAVGAGVVLVASTGVAAEPEVDVGGYHDAALRAAQRELLTAPADDTDSWLGSVHVGTSTDAGSALTTFTPRFGGVGAVLGMRHAEPEAGEPAVDSAPAARQRLEFGLQDTSEIGGLAVPWSAKAKVGPGTAVQDDPSSFVLGGELAVSGVRFDAGYGDESTPLGVSGSGLTAGVAYGFGPLDARISYSVVNTETASEASMVALGSQLKLRPGLVLHGDLAYAQEQNSGDAATAGVVSLRFNF
jgi:Gram-negative porin